MAVVITDTSPIKYLVLIGEVQILPALYGRVLIPAAVIEELRHKDAPLTVGEWAANPPDWIDLVPSDSIDVDPELAELDRPGERAAFVLAMNKTGALLLMDEIRGRTDANRRRVVAIGTLGVLRDAAAIGLIDLAGAFGKLRQTTFRCPERVMAELLEQETKRGSGSPSRSGNRCQRLQQLNARLFRRADLRFEQFWAMRDGSGGKYGSGGNEESVTYRFPKCPVGSNPTLTAI